MKQFLICRALQMAGCLQLKTFHETRGVLPRYFAGGTWRASLHREGRLYTRGHGGTPKPKKKRPLKNNQLASEHAFDKNFFRVGGWSE